MKILKGLFKVIFDSLMLAAIVALIFSINGKKVFNDLLYNNVFKPVVSEEINTIVGKEVESNELDELLNNEETKKLIDDYINSTIGDLSSDGDDVDTDVGDRFLQYVKDNREFFEEKFGVTITDENIDKIKKTDDYKNVVKEYKETIKVTKFNQ